MQFYHNTLHNYYYLSSVLQWMIFSLRFQLQYQLFQTSFYVIFNIFWNMFSYSSFTFSLHSLFCNSIQTCRLPLIFNLYWVFTFWSKHKARSKNYSWLSEVKCFSVMCLISLSKTLDLIPTQGNTRTTEIYPDQNLFYSQLNVQILMPESCQPVTQLGNFFTKLQK